MITFRVFPKLVTVCPVETRATFPVPARLLPLSFAGKAAHQAPSLLTETPWWGP